MQDCPGQMWHCLRYNRGEIMKVRVNTVKKLATLIIVPVIVTVIGSIIVIAIKDIIYKEPALTISSEGNTLRITNNTDQVLYIRVAYNIVEGGTTTFCYPNPTRSDTTEDPQIWPGATEDFPPRHCNQNINGYKVWAWHNQYNKLVFETEG